MNMSTSMALVCALLSIATKDVKGLEGGTVPMFLASLILMLLGIFEAMIFGPPGSRK